ncbi:hypothetical protein ACU8KH_03850 [Lachancea thermotolerans]
MAYSMNLFNLTHHLLSKRPCDKVTRSLITFYVFKKSPTSHGIKALSLNPTHIAEFCTE